MTGPGPSAPTPTVFRTVLSHFASGVVVVTGYADGPVGMTCQSFFAVSLEPPLVAISPSVASRSWSEIAATGSFAINVLDADQEDLCLGFGRPSDDKFGGVDWHRGTTGSPLLAGAIAWLDCDIEAIHPAGDHYLVLGRIRELDANTHGKPQGFFKSSFAKLSPKPAPVAEWHEELVWGSGPWVIHDDA